MTHWMTAAGKPYCAAQDGARMSADWHKVDCARCQERGRTRGMKPARLDDVRVEAAKAFLGGVFNRVWETRRPS